MATQTMVPTTVKSGKGISQGMVSELSAFFSVKPGHEEALREACQRFVANISNADRKVIQKLGLRDMRHVIFDDGRRMLWITAFETDWDPYIDDSLTTFGLPTWSDWLQHTSEYPDTLKTASNAQIKQFLQSAQVQATSYFNMFAARTAPQIEKALRVDQAFQQVLDDPAAATALQQPPCGRCSSRRPTDRTARSGGPPAPACCWFLPATGRR